MLNMTRAKMGKYFLIINIVTYQNCKMNLFLLNNFRWENDQAVAEWLLDQYKEESASQQIKDHLKLMKTESMMSQFRTLVRNMSEDEFMEAGILVAQKLSQTKR